MNGQSLAASQAVEEITGRYGERSGRLALAVARTSVSSLEGRPLRLLRVAPIFVCLATVYIILLAVLLTAFYLRWRNGALKWLEIQRSTHEYALSRRLQTSTWLQLMSFYTYAASTAWCTYAAWSCLTYSESADLVPLLNVYEMLILFAPVGVLAWIDMSGVVYSLLTHLSFRHRRAYSLAIFWTIATALGIVVFLASAVFLGAFGLGIVALERIKRNIYSLRSFYRAHLVGGELVMDAEQTVELSRLYVELLEATAVCFRNKLQLTLFIIAASCTLLGLVWAPISFYQQRRVSECIKLLQSATKDATVVHRGLARAETALSGGSLPRLCNLKALEHRSRKLMWVYRARTWSTSVCFLASVGLIAMCIWLGVTVDDVVLRPARVMALVLFFLISHLLTNAPLTIAWLLRSFEASHLPALPSPSTRPVDDKPNQREVRKMVDVLASPQIAPVEEIRVALQTEMRKVDLEGYEAGSYFEPRPPDV